MCALFVYAERFSPRLGNSGLPTLGIVERYEREVDGRWGLLQSYLEELTYHRQIAMPVKGTEFPLMGVHVERGQMREKDPFTDFYALLRYREGQRIERFPGARPRYWQEEEVFMITDNEGLATQTRRILENRLPAAVVLANPQRMVITGIIKDLYSGGEAITVKVVTDPTLVIKGRPEIRHVRGEGTSPGTPYGGPDKN